MNVAPIDFTSSAEDGRTSYADTTAPSRRAVAIACRPATPAPRTTTCAGVTVPAAVINNGKNRGESSAPTRTALYPAQSACEVSASIDCALEMRGTNSSEKAVTPAFCAASMQSWAVVMGKKEIVIAPFFKVAICAGVSGCTESTTSASLSTSPATTRAPALSYSESEA
ncbi:unannotated protein [freshwater metagenome]|uniref:Unannotated protein n=1 Tax=freshwater metagenome TaxID=449393 RepID=A0A6J7QL91_9ZZZZ